MLVRLPRSSSRFKGGGRNGATGLLDRGHVAYTKGDMAVPCSVFSSLLGLEPGGMFPPHSPMAFLVVPGGKGGTGT